MRRLQEINKKIIDRTKLLEFLNDEGDGSFATYEASYKEVCELISLDEIVGYWFNGDEYTVNFMPYIRKDINYSKDGTPTAGTVSFASYAIEGEALGTSIQLQFEFHKGSDGIWNITVWMQEV